MNKEVETALDTIKKIVNEFISQQDKKQLYKS